MSGNFQNENNSQSEVQPQSHSQIQALAHNQMVQAQVQSIIQSQGPPALENIPLGSSTFSSMSSRLYSSLTVPPPTSITSANSFLQTQFPALFTNNSNINLPPFDPNMQLDSSFSSLMTRVGSAFQAVDTLQIPNTEQNH